MSLSTPRSIFGVHSVAPYNRTDRTFYGIMKVLESSSLSLSGKQVDLYGGSNKYPWASETGEISAEMSLKVSQAEDFMFYLFLGKQPTATTNETNGNVSVPVNVKGTSIMAATGLASVALKATHQADLKFGKYTLVAIDATHVKILAASDVDFSRGTTPETYADDTLLTTAGSSLAISTGTGTDDLALGLTLTGGASATAFVAGDTATFEIRQVNTKASVAVIGSAADVFPEFGAIIVAQKRSSDELFELDAYRCKASGMPIGFDMFAWNKTDVKAKLLYDSAKDGVFGIRAVRT